MFPVSLVTQKPIPVCKTAIQLDRVCRFGEDKINLRQARMYHLKHGLKNTLMIPVLPLLGFYGLDTTGVTDFISEGNAGMTRVLGEGFGHAGLCFSLHYVINAGKHFWRCLVADKRKYLHE